MTWPEGPNRDCSLEHGRNLFDGDQRPQDFSTITDFYIKQLVGMEPSISEWEVKGSLLRILPSFT